MRALFAILIAIGLVGSVLDRAISSLDTHVRSDVRDAVQEPLTKRSEAVAALAAKNDPQFTSQDGTALEIQRSSDGQFYADVRINGTPVHMMIDTGASELALSRNDAQNAGIATSIAMNDVVGRGADGEVHGQIVKLERVELGPLSAEGLDAIVLNSGNQSLLGQSFLSKFASVKIEGDRMILR